MWIKIASQEQLAWSSQLLLNETVSNERLGEE